MNIHNFTIKLVLLFLVSIGLPFVAMAQYDFDNDIGPGVGPGDFSRVGGSGWQFLKIQTDARTAAVAGISTVLSRGDASSALTNPASTADVENLSFSVSNMKWIADIQYNSASIVKNLGKWGHVGINLVYLDYGTMYRTRNEKEVEQATGAYTGRVFPETDLGTFSGGDLAVGLSYARNVTDRLQIGGNVRYISETLDDGSDATTSNWALDIGTVYYTGIKTLRVAMTGRNFGPDARFAEYSEAIQYPAVDVSMPMIFALGTAIDVLEQKDDSPHLLTAAAEFTHPNDGPEKLHVGAEYSYWEWLWVRGGYKFNYDEQALTLGGGIKFVLSNLDLLLNYSYVDFGRLEQVHMFTFGFKMN